MKPLQSPTLPYPFLIWDSSLDPNFLSTDRPFRNLSDLLLGPTDDRAATLPYLQNVMSLCAVDREVLLSGSAFEKFAALAQCLEYLPGHPATAAVDGLLSFLLGDRVALRLATCEELWEVGNDALAGLRPSTLLSGLGVEALALRTRPFTSPEALSFPDTEIKRIFDLSDAAASPRALKKLLLRGLPDPSTDLPFSVFTDRLLASLEEFYEADACALRLALGSSFRFCRNPRKRELDGVAASLLDGKAVGEEGENALATSLLLTLLDAARERGLPVILSVGDGDCREIHALFRHMASHTGLPRILLIGQPASLLPLAEAFAFRTERGFPGILPILPSFPVTGAFSPEETSPAGGAAFPTLAEYARLYPARFLLLPCETVNDPVSLFLCRLRHDSLRQAVNALLPTDPEEAESLAEDIGYANIRNYFSL